MSQATTPLPTSDRASGPARRRPRPRLVFETSVLVAALDVSHPDHERTVPWVRAVNRREVDATLGWTTISEVFAALTRQPWPDVSAATAQQALGRLVERFRLVDVTGELIGLALDRCTAKNLPRLDAALHMVLAESIAANGVVTFEGALFERLRTSVSPKILEPPEPPALNL